MSRAILVFSGFLVVILGWLCANLLYDFIGCLDYCMKYKKNNKEKTFWRNRQMKILKYCDLLIGNRPENDSDTQYYECEECHRYEICKKWHEEKEREKQEGADI